MWLSALAQDQIIDNTLGAMTLGYDNMCSLGATAVKLMLPMSVFMLFHMAP